MSAAAPWSVKGIDPKAREIAKDLARRSGMTLGDWLNSMILEDEDDGVTPLPRRAPVGEIYERRGRSRRLEDAYGASEDRRAHRAEPEDTLQRVAAAVDAIAVRIEAAEHRSTAAIESVDRAVSGLVRRMDGQDAVGAQQERRLDGLVEEMRAGHVRLTRFEKDGGEHVASSFSRMETAVGALANRLYGIEEFQRASVADLRDRMAVVQQAAGAGPGADALADVGLRLDAAQAQTTEALKALERSFAGLDQRLRVAEGRRLSHEGRDADDGRLEPLAEALTRQFEDERAEMMQRLGAAEADGRLARIEQTVTSLADQLKTTEQRGAQAVEAMGQEVLRIARNLNGRMSRTEAQVETVDQDARIARLEQAGELLGQALSDKIDRDMGRYARGIEQRMVRSDDQHALALEKLGSEIARISDRLADRIAQSERRSAQALEDIGERLARSSEKVEQRHERTSSELSERMRQSEERTTRLLAEARESMEQRGQTSAAAVPAKSAQHTAAPDWRSAAFPEDDFGAGDDGWSRDPLASDIEPSPFPAMSFAETALFEPEAQVAAPSQEQPISPPLASTFATEAASEIVAPSSEAVASPSDNAQPGPFTGFGGADVSEALKATDPALDTSVLDDDDQSETYSADTEFVDPRALRAGAAAGRAASAQDTVGAAREALRTSEPMGERKGFGLGLGKGGKSKLQERLDKQAAREGSTLKKSFLASVTAVVLVGGMFATARLTGVDGFDLSAGEAPPGRGEAATLAAMALTPIDVDTGGVSEASAAEATALYDQATEKLDAGDLSGVEILTQAAGLGQPQAQLKLAGLYQTGASGVTRDAGQSRVWARRAAQAGDARGMHAYGMYLFDGVGGERDRPEALTWLVRAADLGLIDSQYNAARIYENGDEGIEPDASQAYKWYLIASRSGDQQAQAAVERMSAELPAATRNTARAEADAFQAEQAA